MTRGRDAGRIPGLSHNRSYHLFPYNCGNCQMAYSKVAWSGTYECQTYHLPVSESDYCPEHHAVDDTELYPGEEGASAE